MFPHYKQLNSNDCGPTCIRIISKYYGKIITSKELREVSILNRQGTSLLNLSNTAERIGFKSLKGKLTYNDLKRKNPFPCIIHWKKSHFIVVYKIRKNKVFVSDPAHGLLKYEKKEFIKLWIKNGANENLDKGIVLLLEPTQFFFKSDFKKEKGLYGFSFLFKYIFRYKKFLIQIVLGLIAGSILQLIVPFLTQSVVDIGIKNQDIHFIYLVLIAELMLFVSSTAISFVRSWIFLHFSTRVSISLISDFFIKLMNLPIAYFDTRMTGDILQRIGDNSRIQGLLTGTPLTMLFSIINLFLFGLILAYYSLKIFVIYLIGTIFYVLWILIFLKKRKDLDYMNFAESSKVNSKVIELINGMQEIKLHNAERKKRWDWEYLQVQLFKISKKGLILTQTQGLGSAAINQLKNIIISILTAKLVIDGDLTLGMMLAIQYIIGQINSPISRLVGFIHTLQDAKISLDRLNEIYDRDDEEKTIKENLFDIPEAADILIKNLSFNYPGYEHNVLNNINILIPNNKITAIVGSSGGGKTTLMKVLLKFYDPEFGEIKIGNTDLKNVSHKLWRENVGVVMQDGFIFNDTIANNIAIGVDFVDKKQLLKSAQLANINEFIESLPLSYNTIIGMEGVGLSAGQKQRLLIARAIYKNPRYLFFDEATSALDTKNEREIMHKLHDFYKNKTVFVIAHRLSTIKNADQIIVLNNGMVVEIGDHNSLVKNNGIYYNLVKDQLQLNQLD